MRPVAIFNTGPYSPGTDGLFEALGGDNDYVFSRCLGLAAREIVEFKVEADGSLPDADEVSAVVVTGSPAMVTDRAPWSERTARWIADNAGSMPMLGVCFGHQLIGHALGGTVTYNPAGSEYGTVTVETTPAAAGDPLLRGIPQHFLAQAAHSQCIATLPKEATLLARNSHGVQAVRYAQAIWGLQFHPEFDAAFMRILLTSFAGYVSGLGLDSLALRQKIVDSPVALGVLQNFRRVIDDSEARPAAGLAAR